jgi:hypothetical protein
MDEIVRRATEGQESGIPKIMVYRGNIAIWEPEESTLEKKFQRIVAVY